MSRTIDLREGGNFDPAAWGPPASIFFPGMPHGAHVRLEPGYTPYPFGTMAVVIGQPAVAPTGSVGKNPKDNIYGPLGTPIDPPGDRMIVAPVPRVGGA